MQFTDHFKDGLDVIPLKKRDQKQNNFWEKIGAGTTKMHLLPADRFRE